MWIVRGASHLLAAIVLYGTVCPWIPSKAWWVRTMDFPRVQFCVLGVLAVAGLWLARTPARRWRHGVLGLALIVALGIHAVRIHPFTPLASKTVPDLPVAMAAEATSVRLLVANVQFDNEDAAPFLAHVREEDPDLILAIETDRAWIRRLHPLEVSHPHGLREPRADGVGIALYSRLPLRHVAVHHLVSRKRPSIEAVVTLPDGSPLRFWGMHPAPPGLEEPDGDRKSSAERDIALMRVARKITRATDGIPTIVAGDFNDAAWSPTTRRFKRVSRMLDPREGRGLFNTYHASWFFLRYPIDHIFLSDAFYIRELRRLHPIGSDHFPMLLEAALPPKEVEHDVSRPRATRLPR